MLHESGKTFQYKFQTNSEICVTAHIWNYNIKVYNQILYTQLHGALEQ